MYQIIETDALEYLMNNKNVGSIFCTSPDSDELGIKPSEWYEWTKEVIYLVINARSPGCPLMFFNTDRKANGHLQSKSTFIMNTCLEEGLEVVFHKIALRKEIGKIDLYRPTFSHLICIGDDKIKLGRATPDVFRRGEMFHKNSIGVDSARIGLEFLKRYSDNVLVPFCGRGTIPYVAHKMGMNVTGLDLNPECVKVTSELCQTVESESIWNESGIRTGISGETEATM